MTMLQARPTTYKGIQMRSRTEALYASSLDRYGYDWEYEPRCYANEKGQYLPDFLIKREGKASLFVEVKGKIGELLPILDQMSVVFCSEPNAELLLVEWSTGKSWVGTSDFGGHLLWQSSVDEFRSVVCLEPSHQSGGRLCRGYER